MRGLPRMAWSRRRVGCCAECRVADLVQQHRFADGGQWLAAWEAAWQGNLASCNATGDCLIQLT